MQGPLLAWALALVLGAVVSAAPRPPGAGTWLELASADLSANEPAPPVLPATSKQQSGAEAAAASTNPAALVANATVQMQAENAEEDKQLAGKPSPEEVTKTLVATQKAIAGELAKDDEARAARVKKYGKDLRPWEVKERAVKEAPARATRDAQKKIRRAAEDADSGNTAGTAARHLSKLDYLTGIEHPTEDTLNSMEQEGTLLVKAMLRSKPAAQDGAVRLDDDAATSGMRDARQTKLNAELHTEKVLQAEDAAKRAKADEKRADKSLTLRRVVRRLSKSEWDEAKAEELRSAQKVTELDGQSPPPSKHEFERAQQAARVAKAKSVLAHKMYQVQDANLKEAEEMERHAKSAVEQEDTTLADIQAKQKVLEEEVKEAKEALTNVHTDHARAQDAARAKSIMKGLNEQRKTSELEGKQFHRQAGRDKQKMMEALRRGQTDNNPRIMRTFNKYKDLAASKRALVAQREAEVKATDEKIATLEKKQADARLSAAESKVLVTEEELKGAKVEGDTQVEVIQDRAKESQAALKKALATGNKYDSQSAVEAVQDTQDALARQAKLKTKVEDLTLQLNMDQATERLVQKQNARISEHANHAKIAGMANNGTKAIMELKIASSLKRAKRASMNADTPERIIRNQAKINLRNEERKLHSQDVVVKMARKAKDKAADEVKTASRKAKVTATEYLVLLHAAGIADGPQLKKATNKAMKWLNTLDKAEATLAHRVKQDQDQENKRRKMKAELVVHTNAAEKALRRKVDAATDMEIQRRSAQRELDHDHELKLAKRPAEYVAVAKEDVVRLRRALASTRQRQRVTQMQIVKQQTIIKDQLTKHGGHTEIAKKAETAMAALRETAVMGQGELARREKKYQHAYSVLQSRKDQAQAAVAYINSRRDELAIPKEFITKEQSETKQILRGMAKLQGNSTTGLSNKTLALDAKQLATLALSNGGQAEMEAIMNKAVVQAKAKKGVTKTLHYIDRKLNEFGWAADLKEEGYTKDQYEASQIAREEDGVQSGLYGNEAKAQLAAKIAKLDALPFTGDEHEDQIKGLTRSQYRVKHKANQYVRRQDRSNALIGGVDTSDPTYPLEWTHDSNLHDLVHTVHKKPGMSSEQLKVAMDEVEKARIDMGTPVDTNPMGTDSNQMLADRHFEALVAAEEDTKEREDRVQRARDVTAAVESQKKGMAMFDRLWGDDDGSKMSDNVDSGFTGLDVADPLTIGSGGGSGGL